VIVENIELFYLSMPEILDEADGSQDALIVKVEAGGFEGWGECEASPLTSIANFICPKSHSAANPIKNSIINSITDIENVEKIIFSFHGMPFRYLKEGDPYFCFCHKTARLVAEDLKLEKDKYILAFQSRFGREEWLKPYVDDEIVNLAKSGVKNLHIISPGFSVDCLETLEEIQIGYKELFIENGGESLKYIPCLNSNEDQINMLQAMVEENIQGW